MWKAGPDHGAKVTHYLLQFNASDAPDVWYDYYETIDGEKLRFFAELPPWGTYTFRLLAHNELGVGPPSRATALACTTPPDRPDRNPKNVRTRTHKKKFLVVEWTVSIRLLFVVFKYWLNTPRIIPVSIRYPLRTYTKLFLVVEWTVRIKNKYL